MEVINPFLQENKQRIIAFLDEISASTLHIVDLDDLLCGMFYNRRCSFLLSINSSLLQSSDPDT